MRVASHAAECGRAAAFALAAGRLAWCGGFELDDPEVLAEAAAAASLGLDGALRAGGDIARDGRMEAAALRLLGAGANKLPAVVADRRLFAGELRLAVPRRYGRCRAARSAAYRPSAHTPPVRSVHSEIRPARRPSGRRTG